MTEATFTCERCGKKLPESQKKEVFVDEGGTEVKKVVCPECLDETMNQADDVVGVEGDDKRAAAAVGHAAETTDRETFGERGQDSTGGGLRS